MKISSVICSAILMLMLAIQVNSQDYHVRIGFVGNSITIGSGLANPSVNAYPNQFATMLQAKFGDTCIVSNFGVSGRTMLKHGDYPYWNELFFRNCWNFAPEILIICLGTNDTKYYNWDTHGDEFLDDYLDMIDTFRVRNPFVKVFVCYPPPAFSGMYDINDNILISGILPAVDSVLAKTDATLIDFRTPLLDSAAVFYDGIHPDIRGSKGMAEIVYRKFLETDIIHQVEMGLTFVNSLASAKKLIRVGDSVALSWTTINADSAFLDGKKVPNAGSIYISPEQTTAYKLKAFGVKNNDSLTFTQEVYEPVLTRLSLTPKSNTIDIGDSVVYTALYVDQNSRIITGQDFDPEWTIVEGTGLLVNISSSSATFVATEAGTAKVQIKVEDLTFQSTIKVNAASGIRKTTVEKGILVFPNPAGNILNVQVNARETSAVQIRLYDLNGALQLKEEFPVSRGGIQLIQVNMANLADGIYLYEIENAGTIHSGKITKQVNF